MDGGYDAAIWSIGFAVLIICGWRKEMAGIERYAAPWLTLAALTTTYAALAGRSGGRVSLMICTAVCAGVTLYALVSASKSRWTAGVLPAALSVVCLNMLVAFVSRGGATHMPAWSLAFGAAAIAVCWTRSPLERFASLWLGFVVARMWEPSAAGTLHVWANDIVVLDRLWPAFMTASLLSVLVRIAVRKWRTFLL